MIAAGSQAIATLTVRDKNARGFVDGTAIEHKQQVTVRSVNEGTGIAVVNMGGSLLELPLATLTEVERPVVKQRSKPTPAQQASALRPSLSKEVRAERAERVQERLSALASAEQPPTEDDRLTGLPPASVAEAFGFEVKKGEDDAKSEEGSAAESGSAESGAASGDS